VAVVYGKFAAVMRAAVDDRLIPVSPCGRKIRLPRADGGEVCADDATAGAGDR
jgi:hypothetical protein